MNRLACVRPAQSGGVLALAAALALAAPPLSRPAFAADGYLGVVVQEITPSLARGMDLRDARGVLVGSVDQDGPADRAGLRNGDVILEVDGDQVGSISDFRSKIADAGAGSPVSLRIVRDGDERNVRATLGSRSEQDTSGRREEQIEGEEDVPTPPEAPSPPAPSDNGERRARVFRFPNDETGGGGFLGVRLGEMSDQLRSYFGISGDAGVLVTGVESSSAADRAGLRAGDVILRIDGRSVTSVAEAQRAIRSHQPGDDVEFRIARDRDTRTIAVELGRAPGGAGGQIGEGDVPDLERIMPELHRQLRDNPEIERQLRDNSDRQMGQDNTQQLQAEVRRLRARVNELEQEVQNLRERMR